MVTPSAVAIATVSIRYKKQLVSKEITSFVRP